MESWPTCPSPPPATAAWQHQDARTGFEVVYFRQLKDGYELRGCTTAVQDGQTWAVDYAIVVDSTWTTRSAHITGRSASGDRSAALEADGAGHWQVDGNPAPHLDGCLDVDLESSALTNALPVHRLALALGEHAAAPAAYVRALDLTVERLDQDYVRAASDENAHQRYDYAAPAFGFTCRLVYDESGLVLTYPGPRQPHPLASSPVCGSSSGTPHEPGGRQRGCCHRVTGSRPLWC